MVGNQALKIISLDFIFDIPKQDDEALTYSLDEIYKLQPEHISIYSLEIEEGTKFYDLYKEGKIDISNGEKLLEKYNFIQKKMKEKGYIQYEISNFSKERLFSLHNTNYWKYGEYLGLGLGASSFFKGKRFKAPDNFIEYKNYVRKSFQDIVKNIDIYFNDEVSIFTFTGLRKIEGIDLSEFENKFNVAFDTIYKEQICQVNKLYKNQFILDKGKNKAFIKEEFMGNSSNIMCHFILD